MWPNCSRNAFSRHSSRQPTPVVVCLGAKNHTSGIPLIVDVGVRCPGSRAKAERSNYRITRAARSRCVEELSRIFRNWSGARDISRNTAGFSHRRWKLPGEKVCLSSSVHWFTYVYTIRSIRRLIPWRFSRRETGWLRTRSLYPGSLLRDALDSGENPGTIRSSKWGCSSRWTACLTFENGIPKSHVFARDVIVNPLASTR